MIDHEREPKPSDFHSDEELGEWLRANLIEHYGLETEDWAKERVARVTEALNRVRKPLPALESHILWVDVMTAFTAPGRHVYISRELLERAASDDPIALVIAHEMAHHDLGHIKMYTAGLNLFRHVPGAFDAAVFLRLGDRFVLGPERESAADRRSLELCLKAGYSGKECLELFGLMEIYALNFGDLDIVYGPDDILEAEESGVHGFIHSMRKWTWEHMRGYESLRDRKAALKAAIAQMEDLPAETGSTSLKCTSTHPGRHS